MKKYMKPSVVVEKFMPNVAVAACNKEQTGTVYNPVTVNCLISGSETIFNSGTCQTSVDAGAGNGNSYCIYHYGDYYYLIWPNGSGGTFTGKTDKVGVINNYTGAQGESALRAVYNSAYSAGYLGSGRWQNYHIAPMNESASGVFGFSY